MEWIKVDKFGHLPRMPCLLCDDEMDSVYIGYSAFDFYDADYWMPLPSSTSSPERGIITNDKCIPALLKHVKI